MTPDASGPGRGPGPGPVLGLLAAWSLLVYVNAYHAQPPPFDLAAQFFWPPMGHTSLRGFAFAAWRAAVELARLGLYDLLAWAAGRRILEWLTPYRAFRSGTGRGVAGAGAAWLLGGAAAGLAMFAAAECGLAYPAIALGLAAAAAGMALANARDTARTLRRGGRLALTRLRAVPPAAALLGAVVGAGMLAGALAPEVILDATRYFLEIPRRALLEHRLVPMEGSPLAFTPLLSSMISLPLLALAGETSVKLLSWQAGWLVAALIHEWLDPPAGEGARAPTAPVAPYAAVAWLTLRNVPILGQTAMADLPLAAWVAFAARAQFGPGGSRRLAGVLWGGALGFKFQAGAMLLAAVAGERRGRWRLVLPAAAVCAIWPARNWLAAGWPLYPWAVPAAVAASADSPLPFFFMPLRWAAERTPAGLLAAPYTLAATMAYWDGLLSPLLVALLPLAFTRASAPAARLTLAGSLLAWAWTFGNIGRYLYPIAPLLLVEACRGGAALLRGAAPGRLAPARLLVLALLVYDAAVSFGWAYRMTNPMVVALGRESRAAYVRRLLKPAPATYDMGARLARELPAGARYYLAGELRSYGWPGVALFDSEYVPSNLSRWARGAATPARLRVAFRQRGLTALVAYEQPVKGLAYLAPGPGGWPPRALAVYRDFLSRYARRRGREGEAGASYAWYELLPRPGAPVAPPSPLPAVLVGDGGGPENL